MANEGLGWDPLLKCKNLTITRKGNASQSIPDRMVKLTFVDWIIPGTQVTQIFSMVKDKTKDQQLRGKSWSNFGDLLATWAPNFDR